MKTHSIIPKLVVFGFFTLALLAPEISNAEDAKITSREYKLMLDASKFNGSDPSNAVNTFWTTHLQGIIDDSIGRKSGGGHRYSGTLSLTKERIVRFWDTSSPYKCMLKEHDYIFRERVEVENGQEDVNKREVTLKFRNVDRYLAAKKDMSGTDKEAETKFEEDLGQMIIKVDDGNGGIQRYTDMNPSFRSVYSHSTTQPLSASKKLNKMDDPLGLYRGLENGLEEEGAAVNEDDAIELVSNLEIYERVYKGTSVDLGSLDATFTLTLWYNKADANYDIPLVAEISFRYELEDETDEFTRNVVKRAKDLFLAMQKLDDWIDPTSSTKTTLVYDHANFCD